MSFNRPKKYTARVRLRQPNFANFLKFYHEAKYDDELYRKLAEEIAKHKLLTKVDELKSNCTKEGFYFKTDKVICTGFNGRPCLIEDILDNDVIISIKVTPYDFTPPGGERLVGISIQATEIRAVREL